MFIFNLPTSIEHHVLQNGSAWLLFMKTCIKNVRHHKTNISIWLNLGKKLNFGKQKHTKSIQTWLPQYLLESATQSCDPRCNNIYACRQASSWQRTTRWVEHVLPQNVSVPLFVTLSVISTQLCDSARSMQNFKFRRALFVCFQSWMMQ